MDEVLADDVVPVALAALMPDMPDALVKGDTAAVIDGLELDAVVGVLGDVADDVEDLHGESPRARHVSEAVVAAATT